jgi:hypothetical protein
MQLAVVLLTGTHQHLKGPVSIEVVTGHHDADRCASGAVALQCITQLSHSGLRGADFQVTQLVHLVMRANPRQQLGGVERLRHKVVSAGGEGFHR